MSSAVKTLTPIPPAAKHAGRTRPLFLTGVLLGAVAEQIVLFALPLLIFQKTNDVALLGLAYAIEWLPALLAYPFAGLIADRDGGPRLFSVVTAGRSVVLVLALAGCLLLSDWQTPILMSCGALLALFLAPVHMAIEKVVPQVATGEDLPKTQGLVQSMEVSAMAVGPALALLGVMLVDKTMLLGVAAAVFAAAACCWLPVPRGPRAAKPGSARETMAELGLGWRLLARNKPLVLLAGLNFSINLVFGTALSANAALVTDVFDGPESAFALLNVCIGVVGMANLLVIPFLLRFFDVRVIGVVGLALLCACLVVLGFAPSLLVYGPAFVAAMVGVTYFNVYNRTQRIRVIEPEHLGKVMGPFYMINLLAAPLGGLLLAGLGTSLGPQSLIAISAIALSGVSAVLLPLTMRSFHRALNG
ncbi:MFS transporter [Streptomyces sp. R302]|uniref:MFS transporter n=1 Tax=unclassified Streptomyces TaxID=2593676 RepID=UPI00145E36F6|nr:MULTISPECIES: MFS transporter [unclassified Streptomyces]NML52138.1 MFS transporter [Streptomyces sp. R301]NML82396.1 MFS transporter [Streptomyces sp. R302]